MGKKKGKPVKGRGRRKVRIKFRPNVEQPARTGSSDWTKQLKEERVEIEDALAQETVKAKGQLAKKRTVDPARAGMHLDLKYQAEHAATPHEQWHQGTVVAIHGHFVKVDDGGRVWLCVVRRVLKSLMLDQRNVVTVGDQVHFMPTDDKEGVIERVGDRHGRLLRRYRKREHLIVTNVDQAIIVASVAAPELRIHLVDRYIVAALSGELNPVIVFNKLDLPHDEPLDEYERVYSQLGYKVVRASTVGGLGIDALRKLMKNRKSVVAGVSGVGKSSLLNAVEPGLKLTVKPVNRATCRGQHTTTTVQLLKLSFTGYVVDTPGIRQFAFWNIDRQNLEAYFDDFLPYIPDCKYANCSHIHEDDCAVIHAVENGHITLWRYESYVKMFEDQREFLETWER